MFYPARVVQVRSSITGNTLVRDVVISDHESVLRCKVVSSRYGRSDVLGNLSQHAGHDALLGGVGGRQGVENPVRYGRWFVLRTR